MTFLEYSGPLAAGAHMQIWANTISNKTNDSSGWWHSNREWIHHYNHWVTRRTPDIITNLLQRPRCKSKLWTHKVLADPVG